MRRKDREANDPGFLAGVLNSAETLFLAMFDGEYPYCIPVNFALANSRLYIHSALVGHKLELIAKDPHVAFSAALGIEIDTAHSTTYYKSVCGCGLASIIEDAAEKAFALDRIGERYGALCIRPAPPASVARVAIIRIDITQLSGKHSRPRPK